ncbi:MAG TPA: hypothetical protein VGG11_13860 [Xanthobacteraceae bacterium]|jgi:hypothetical protein
MDLSAIANLGVAGFAILIMWWKDQAHARQLDERDKAFRVLEEEVRTNITAQLISSTSALQNNSKVMERVLDKLTG